MKEPVLVIIKPDGMKKNLFGHVVQAFGETDLELIAVKLIETTRQTVEEHYRHLSEQKFFSKQVSFFLGDTTGIKKLIFLVYYGKNAVEIARALAGATDPEKADVKSIRGKFGRITTQDIYENVIHVSSDVKEAEREIKLWFQAEDFQIEVYPMKKKVIENFERRLWV